MKRIIGAFFVCSFLFIVSGCSSVSETIQATGKKVMDFDQWIQEHAW